LYQFIQYVNMMAKAGKSASAMGAENTLLLREAKKIVEALGKMFAPCCEVLLHDLTQPDHSIIAIENPLSGRQVGESVTEMGLARLHDSSFPDVVQNYRNTFADGRPAKSTSIGLKNSDGKFVAAICLNLDISVFSSVQRSLEQLTSLEATAPVHETLRTRSTKDVSCAIETFAARYNTQAYALSPQQRREVLHQMAQAGLLDVRHAVTIAAEIFGISRASVYHALKKK
jgi:predicted transcriptional regulator YheO